MVTYILLVHFTDQGIRNVKQIRERAKAAVSAGEALDVGVKGIYWTMGRYDAVVIADAPNDEALNAWVLGLGSLGNVRTETLRAFSSDEMQRILAAIP
jgi:uncharacterized protein with GYD domain